MPAAAGPVTAGPASGAAMSLVVDEGRTPLPGFSASNRDHPLITTPAGSPPTSPSDSPSQPPPKPPGA
ncbi:hypothetical protein GCM10022205_58990 [Spinactinospora alkalitolerans]